MSSPCLPAARLALILLCAGALSACEREHRDITTSPPEGGPQVQTTALNPGKLRPLPKDSRGELYEKSAYHVGEGSRLFRWYNCSGCHANGGGGMGPPLIDATWIYGSEIEQIYGTILEGRPNGMPSFRGKIPDNQVWEIAAYVRSMSGQLAKDVSPGRADHMMAKPAESSTERLPPSDGGVPHSAMSPQ